MKQVCTYLTLFLMLCLAGCADASAGKESNFQFTYQGTVITMDEEAAPVTDALGEPQSYTEEVSCAFEGLDKTYYYGSFYLVTYPKEGVDHILRIWFADDSVTTQEGICIGATKADVEKAYGDVFGDQNSGTLIRGDSKLTFILENDVVMSIQYETVIQ